MNHGSKSRAWIFVALFLTSSCATRPAIDSRQSTYGPTVKERAGNEYVLRNRRYSFSIMDEYGTVRVTDAKVFELVAPWFSPDNFTPEGGYIESRDEETWQYIGDSSGGKINWRIVYCLYYDQLNVTYIVQNKSDKPVTGYIALPATQQIFIQPFNEDPTLNKPVADGSVRSDERTLKPGERMNFATRWTLK